MNRSAKRWTGFGTSTRIEALPQAASGADPRSVLQVWRARRRCAARRFAWRRWTVNEHRDCLGGNQPLLADHPRQRGDQTGPPGPPPFLLDLFADAAGKVWENALSQAEAALAEFRSEAERQVREAEALQAEAFERLREALAKIDITRQRATTESEAREGLAIELAKRKSRSCRARKGVAAA
jgi:hypothetical protein